MCMEREPLLQRLWLELCKGRSHTRYCVRVDSFQSMLTDQRALLTIRVAVAGVRHSGVSHVLGFVGDLTSCSYV